MNIALFAGKEVGYRVAREFGTRASPLSYLVLDSKDDSGINEKIADVSRVSNSRIIGSNEVYSTENLEKLRAAGIDLGILAWWPHIVKEPLLGIPRLGYLNFHPSLLPFQRGKHPNFWAITEGTPYGVTLHFIDAGVDTGPIAYQRTIPVSLEDTGKTLYEKALEEIVSLFSDNFDNIVGGNIPRVPQDSSLATFHKAKEIDPASKIDPNKTYRGKELIDILRARTFPPYPGARLTHEGRNYELRLEIKEIKPD